MEAPNDRRGRPRRRRRGRRVVGVLLVLALLVGAGVLVGLRWRSAWRSIERVNIFGGEVQPSEDAKEINVALVGLDGGGHPDSVTLVRRTAKGEMRWLAVPSRIWVPRADGASTLASGRGGVSAVESLRALGLPVDHLIEYDQDSVEAAIDVLGPIDVTMDPRVSTGGRESRLVAVWDFGSGFSVARSLGEERFCVPLDADGVLAVTRSVALRGVTADERLVRSGPDGVTARPLRQLEVIRAVVRDAYGRRFNPLLFDRTLRSVGSTLTVDSTWTFDGFRSFLDDVGATAIKPLSIPVRHHESEAWGSFLSVDPTGAEWIWTSFGADGVPASVLRNVPTGTERDVEAPGSVIELDIAPAGEACSA